MEHTEIYDLIDLDRYPLDGLAGTAGQKLIDQTRAALDQEGSCSMPGFVDQSTVAEMAAEASNLQHLAYPGPTEVTPYFFNYDLGKGADYSDDHPLKRKGKRNLSQVASDLIPDYHKLSRLYHSPVLTDFLAAVLDQTVYRNQDKYQSLNISVMNAGGCQQWHFDSGLMVTTLLLQAPESGGVFEYVPELRSDESENYEQVQQVLDGDSNRVKRLKLEAGTLSLFRGHYSMHRVTEVEGSRTRIQAILGFSTTPDLQGNLESSILHYGPRVTRIENREH
ncbi:MAG: phytanoyl-CoA dioxygenase family protein [Gammaproteobacteria bacterium]|nr:phytanoyl-CoA dioxygenase family protein [Gammaproteobacteria bacterium]